MSNSDETLEQPTVENEPTLREVLDAISQLNKRFDKLEEENNAQFEAIREGIVSNSARFDQLEALALEAKSIALINRSQLTILTEELRHNRKVLA